MFPTLLSSHHALSFVFLIAPNDRHVTLPRRSSPLFRMKFVLSLDFQEQTMAYYRYANIAEMHQKRISGSK